MKLLLLLTVMAITIFPVSINQIQGFLKKGKRPEPKGKYEKAYGKFTFPLYGSLTARGLAGVFAVLAFNEWDNDPWIAILHLAVAAFGSAISTLVVEGQANMFVEQGRILDTYQELGQGSREIERLGREVRQQIRDVNKRRGR